MTIRAKNLFIGHRHASPTDVANAWTSGTFVVDANVLLDLYRYGPQLRADVLNSLTKLDDRAWVPYHALLEYHENRASVILEQQAHFETVKGAALQFAEGIRQTFDKQRITRQRSLIDPTEFLARIRSATDDFTRHIDQQFAAYPNRIIDDEIRVAIDELFGDRVGAPPASQAELDELLREAKKRFEHSIPPGHEDKSKDRPLVHNGLRYERKYGDVLVWKEVIEIARRTGTTALVFVTNDRKRDWWNIVQGRTIGPRTELVEELGAQSSVSTFLMFTVESFLHHAKEHLGVNIGADSIGEAQDVLSSGTGDRNQRVWAINRDDILDAMSAFDLESRETDSWIDFPHGAAHYRHKHAILHSGKLYPLKEIMSLASGVPSSGFSSGPRAVKKLRTLGFHVVGIAELGNGGAEDD